MDAILGMAMGPVANILQSMDIIGTTVVNSTGVRSYPAGAQYGAIIGCISSCLAYPVPFKAGIDATIEVSSFKFGGDAGYQYDIILDTQTNGYEVKEGGITIMWFG